MLEPDNRTATRPSARPAPNDRIRGYIDAYARYLGCDVDMTLSPTDSMADAHYMSAGRAAIDTILSACIASWLPEVRYILDVPCGHGRVLRHLKAMFPAADVHVCDLDQSGLAFCATHFRATPILSHVDPDRIALPIHYDLIWVGSLFTHLTREANLAWLNMLAKHLSPQGIIVATFHGRYVRWLGDGFGYIDAGAWSTIKDQYEKTGFGFAPYGEFEVGHVDGAYGVSLSSPASVLTDAMQIPDTRVFGYFERGWGSHHDVLVLGKPGIPDVAA